MAAQGNPDRFTTPIRMPFRNDVNERRDERLRYRAPFSVFWDERTSQPKYAKALSNEVSERGLSLEVSQHIEVGTKVSLRSENGALFGGACVKHVTQRGAGYVFGVELSYYVLDDALALVRDIYGTPGAR